MTQPTDKWKEAVLDTLAVTCMDAPLTESPDSILKRVIDWHIDLAKAEARTAALNEQSAEMERMKGEITHLREVAAIQHEYEEVCEFYIQCSPTPKGLLEWFGTISKDIP